MLCNGSCPRTQGGESVGHATRPDKSEAPCQARTSQPRPKYVIIPALHQNISHTLLPPLGVSPPPPGQQRRPHVVKLSPQPHVPLAWGFSKMNSALQQRRAESVGFKPKIACHLECLLHACMQTHITPKDHYGLHSLSGIERSSCACCSDMHPSPWPNPNIPVSHSSPD